MRALLRIRDARVFLLGSAVSMLGDTAMFLALGIWAKALTGSNSAAGLVFFVLALPSLFSPLAGLVVDRVRKRPLLIGTNCVMSLALLLLLFVHDRSDLWLIYLVAGLYGASGTVMFSARSAFMTVLLPRELLGDANAIFSTVREGTRLLSPLVGAGLYAAFGGAVVAVADAVTFVAFAVALAFVRTPEPKPSREQNVFLAELAAGVKHVFATVPLRQIVLATGTCLLVIGFAETLIFAVVDNGLHRPPSFLGVLESLQGVGAILGGVTAGAALRRFGDLRLVGIGMLAFAAGDGTFASSNLPLVCAGFIVAGFGVAWLIVGFMTAIQLRTPHHLQGRVASAADTMISTPQTVSIALGAALVSVVDYRLLVAVMAAVICGCAAFLLTRGPEPIAAEEPVPA
ncbi:MAG TPA: MFS transporter [Gaiellaceae bacterium]|nr:MFS transporter [Gaiellaceae bacterium]